MEATDMDNGADHPACEHCGELGDFNFEDMVIPPSEAGYRTAARVHVSCVEAYEGRGR